MKALDVINELGYESSSGNWLTPTDTESPASRLWHVRQEKYVLGSYVFKTSPGTDPILPPKPAIHVAQAHNEVEARRIHREMWNLSTAPFLLLILPDQVRAYAGFNYDPRRTEAGRIVTAELTAADIGRRLRDFYADEIDSGRIWRRQAANLSLEKRVDQSLLRNLEQLGDQLVRKMKLESPFAHALIGKYIYIRYLVDRKILTDRWLDNKPSLDDVLGRNASLAALQRLTERLEDRFNGEIFPLDFDAPNAPDDSSVAYVASIFRGDEAMSGQLALDFQAYDFSYIPVEMLSSIYEQFLRREGKGKDKGAVYTREFLADYLLCELNNTKPLKKKMKILDAACGSGVFLVLSYRRLIEQELREKKKKFLSPEKLAEILTESIYGVEVIDDACYVTEFSLILTLLSYVYPPELENNESFRFPTLHNKNIFNCDFFDDKSEFWRKELRFHWVIGNPSWSKLKAETAGEQQKHAWDWITENAKSRPVGKYSLSEAFSWRVTDVLAPKGHVGLLLHATSLFNRYSRAYRSEFFEQHDVFRVTNFANLVYILFKGRSDAPAASIVYTRSNPQRKTGKPPIVHYGPFVANQIFFRQAQDQEIEKQAWTIVIYEDEIQTIDPNEAATGNAAVWKLALWGTYRDQVALKQLKRLFPSPVQAVAKQRNWKLHEGLDLRNLYKERKKGDKAEELEYLTELKTLKLLDVDKISGKLYLTVPSEALDFVPQADRYVRKRGGKAGLAVSKAPHIFWNVMGAAYSNLDFVTRNPHVVLSGPKPDTEYLSAVAAYLTSSFGQYLLFFEAASWGIDRSKFAKNEAARVHIPSFSDEQVRQLASLHHQLAEVHAADPQGSLFEVNIQKKRVLTPEVKTKLTDQVARVLRIPDHLKVLAQDFTEVRYQLLKGKISGTASKPAKSRELNAYAQYLIEALDGFAKKHHQVNITSYDDFVHCTVAITRSNEPFKPKIEDGKGDVATLATLWSDLGHEFSQWVYVQRSLRTFIGDKLHLIKSARLIDWTRTQAMMDADDIIAEVLNGAGNLHETSTQK